MISPPLHWRNHNHHCHIPSDRRNKRMNLLNYSISISINISFDWTITNQSNSTFHWLVWTWLSRQINENSNSLRNEHAINLRFEAKAEDDKKASITSKRRVVILHKKSSLASAMRISITTIATTQLVECFYNL